MAHIVSELNLNKTPQLTKDYSMIFAKNIKLQKDASITKDSGMENIPFGNIENLNKQLRKHFPKKKSIDHLTRADVKNINSRLLRSSLHSLDGNSPQIVFETIFSKEDFTNLIK